MNFKHYNQKQPVLFPYSFEEGLIPENHQLEELWKYAQSVAKEEDKDLEPPEFKEISKEKIRLTFLRRILHI